MLLKKISKRVDVSVIFQVNAVVLYINGIFQTKVYKYAYKKDGAAWRQIEPHINIFC